jgi:hypothetical protein
VAAVGRILRLIYDGRLASSLARRDIQKFMKAAKKKLWDARASKIEN